MMYTKSLEALVAEVKATLQMTGSVPMYHHPTRSAPTRVAMPI